jgi:hypothetical protein
VVLEKKVVQAALTALAALAVSKLPPEDAGVDELELGLVLLPQAARVAAASSATTAEAARPWRVVRVTTGLVPFMRCLSRVRRI